MADFDPDFDPRAETLHRAALLVIKARKEAVKMLRRAGVELPDTGRFTSPCTRITAPGVRCGCDEYSGDGGVCRTRFEDHTVGDFGTGPVLMECNHPALEHVSAIAPLSDS